MAQRSRSIALYATGAAAMAVLAGGFLMMFLRAPELPPTAPHVVDQGAPPPPAATAADAPLTTTSPAAASNGRLTIRLIGGQPEK